MKLIPKGVTPTHVAVGAGVVILAPIVLPLIGQVVKPVVKAVIKGGIMTYEGIKVTVAESKEALEDITAEAKAEVASNASEGE
ncbi:DUF5132 domain-containing protein [Desulfobacter sp.]|jgi:hypothetical protein